jgi:hypothetical protein
MLFGLLGRGVLPILRLKPFTLSLSLSALAGDTLLPGDLLVKEHVISVPVDHGTGPNGRFGSLEVFVREIVPASKSTNADMLTASCICRVGPASRRAGRSICCTRN